MLKASFMAKAKSYEQKRGINPTLAAKDITTRRAFLRAQKLFHAAYRAALELNLVHPSPWAATCETMEHQLTVDKRDEPGMPARLDGLHAQVGSNIEEFPNARTSFVRNSNTACAP